MTVCILGNGLTSLTLAKALVNHEIKVDVFLNKKNSFDVIILIPVKNKVKGIK